MGVWILTPKAQKFQYNNAVTHLPIFFSLPHTQTLFNIIKLYLYLP